MTPFPWIETPRLILRRFTEADLPAFVAYRNDPEVARYQSWEAVDEAQARAFIEEQKASQPGAAGQWLQIALEAKATAALVGDCALKVEEEDSRQAEIGFTLAREYQGRGFASEAVARLLDFVFLDMELHRVTAVTDCENAASVALLEGLGLRREGHFLQNVWFKGRWGDEYLYAVLRSEWWQRGLR
jgi:RimJ/RimL family protein N-acetyltransferase